MRIDAQRTVAAAGDGQPMEMRDGFEPRHLGRGDRALFHQDVGGFGGQAGEMEARHGGRVALRHAETGGLAGPTRREVRADQQDRAVENEGRYQRVRAYGQRDRGSQR